MQPCRVFCPALAALLSVLSADAARPSRSPRPTAALGHSALPRHRHRGRREGHDLGAPGGSCVSPTATETLFAIGAGPR